MSGLDRRALRAALRETEPWLTDPDRGPRAVDAGACDRCGELPRLLPTCGPQAAEALCRPCVLEVGLDAWCDGHAEEGREALRWASRLPPHWDLAVTLWWVATGELRSVEPRSLRDAPTLPAGVRGLLDRG
jgi:hypothetical protein